MDKYWKKLIIVFILLVLIKIVLSSFVFTPTQFADEYWYQRMAQSFSRGEGFLIDENPSTQYPPLYPIIISLGFIFQNMKIVYLFMKILNCLISSTILFGGFLLAKEFISKSKAFKVSILISLIPPMFGFFPFIMSENLFYPLFLFTIYFMYKSLIEKGFYWPLLTGVLIGFCSLTRINGLFLIVIYGLVLFVKLLRDKRILNFLKKGVLSSFGFFMIYIWWMLRNYGVTGNIFGRYNKDVANAGYKLASNFLKNYSLIIITNLMYLIISAIIIFFIYSLYFKGKEKHKEFKILSFITILVYIILISLFNYKITGNGRLITRYFIQVLPLIIIMGSYKTYKIKKIIFIPLLLILSAISSKLLISNSLFPVNNFDLSYLGIMIMFLSKYFVLILIILLPLLVFLLLKINMKKLINLAIVFFILINILNVAIVTYNSDYRWDCDFMKIGKEFGKLNVQGVVVFDNEENRDVNKIKGGAVCDVAPISLGGFWINQRVIRLFGKEQLKDIKNKDYIVSTKKLNLKIILQKGDIFIYKV